LPTISGLASSFGLEISNPVQVLLHSAHHAPLRGRIVKARDGGVTARPTSALPGLAPALPAPVALNDEEDGDETDSSADRNDTKTAQRVTGARPRVRHRIYTVIQPTYPLYHKNGNQTTRPIFPLKILRRAGIPPDGVTLV